MSKALVWQIERIFAEDKARAIIFFDRRATCGQPQLKDFTLDAARRAQCVIAIKTAGRDQNGGRGQN